MMAGWATSRILHKWLLLLLLLGHMSMCCACNCIFSVFFGNTCAILIVYLRLKRRVIKCDLSLWYGILVYWNAYQYRFCVYKCVSCTEIVLIYCFSHLAIRVPQIGSQLENGLNLPKAMMIFHNIFNSKNQFLAHFNECVQFVMMI